MTDTAKACTQCGGLCYQAHERIEQSKPETATLPEDVRQAIKWLKETFDHPDYGGLLARESLRAEQAEREREEANDDRQAIFVEMVERGKQLVALRAERYAAYGYLSRLLTHIAPKCEPLDDLSGVVTQIDNMLVGILAERDALREACKILIGSWREAAAFEFGDMGNSQSAQSYDQCADDLDAVLGHPSPEEKKA